MANRRRFAARRSGGRRPPGAGLDRTQAEGRAGASPHQAGLPGAQGQGRDHIGRASARPRSPATAAPGWSPGRTCSRPRPPAPTCLTRIIAGDNDVALPRGPRRGGRRLGLWREPRLTGKAGSPASTRPHRQVGQPAPWRGPDRRLWLRQQDSARSPAATEGWHRSPALPAAVEGVLRACNAGRPRGDGLRRPPTSAGQSAGRPGRAGRLRGVRQRARTRGLPPLFPVTRRTVCGRS